MTNRSSPYKWRYEKLIDEEADPSNCLTNSDGSLEDRDYEQPHDTEFFKARQLLQANSSSAKEASCEDDEETIIFDLEYSKDYYELKKRSQRVKKSTTNQTDTNHYIYYKIEKNDTLQGIALKWHCSLNELKRVNNLVSDQDFYGLNIIKVPVKKYGILSEVMVHQVNSSNLTLLDQKLEEITSKPLVINVGLRKTFQYDDNAQDMNKFLSNLDADLEKMRKVVDNYVNKDENIINFNSDKQLMVNQDHQQCQQQQQLEVNLSSTSVDQTVPLSKSKNAYQCDGADCGLSWYSLFFVALLILVLIPVIYAFGASNGHQI